jgi:transposase-like protein
MKDFEAICPDCKSTDVQWLGRFGKSVEGADDVTKKVAIYKCNSCKRNFADRLPYSAIKSSCSRPFYAPTLKPLRSIRPQSPQRSLRTDHLP